MKISAAFVSEIENGMWYPSEDVLPRLAAALGTTVEDLKRYDHRPPTKEIQELVDLDPRFGFAFRKMVNSVRDLGLSPFRSGETGAWDETEKEGVKMKQQRANTGPFSRRIYYEQRDVESLCSTALAGAGLLPETPRPVRIDRFVEKHFRVEVRATEMKPGLMGAIRFDEAGNVLGVYVSKEVEDDTSDAGRRRVRSTIGHEAGHGLLHARLFAEKLLTDSSQYDFDAVSGGEARVRRDGFMCRPELGAASRRYEWWEFQANMAMSCLLLPWPLITLAAEPYRARYADAAASGRDQVAEDAALALAEIFDVNPIMIRYRLKDWWKEALQLSLL